MKNKILVLLCIICLSGCFMSSPRKKTVSKPVSPQLLKIEGNIVNQEKLSQGGKLAFTDLKAGPLAVADEQTDRVSLKIIQGVTDVIINNNAGLEITNDPYEANLVFEGYIEEFVMPGKFSKTVLFKNQSRISISGELYDRKTGLRVLSFASSKTFNIKKENPSQVALSIGEAIGQFIVKHSSKERL